MKTIHPAIAEHVMEENERLRGLLRELREITSEYAWDADLEARVDAALSQQAEPVRSPGTEDTATLDCVPELEDIAAALSAVTAERDRVLAEREGKVLVPTEPTEAMLTAYSTNPNHVASAGAIYRAMLSAAMAAKETEPEHVCSGCGEKGWTGNCLACIPY